jgi:hypothetical protein
MTIISYNKNFIFIKSRKTAGTSMEIALSKFCGAEDVIAPIGPFGEDERMLRKFLTPQNFLNKKKPKKLNTALFRNFIFSLIKSLPLIKKIFKFNYPPNFTLRPLFVENRIATECGSLKLLKKTLDNHFYDNSFKFTIVRNPYDQFLSFYHWEIFRKRVDPNKSIYDFTKSNAYYFFNLEKSILLDDNGKLDFDLIIRYENLEKDLKMLSKRLGLNEEIYEIFKNIRTKANLRKKDVKLDEKSRKLIYKNAKFFFKEFGYEY